MTTGGSAASEGRGQAREGKPAPSIRPDGARRHAVRQRHGRRCRPPEGSASGGPKASAPAPPSKAGKGALRPSIPGALRRCSRSRKFAVLVRAGAANDGGLLFGRRLHVREYALGPLLCEWAAAWRALATAMEDGRRRYRDRG